MCVTKYSGPSRLLRHLAGRYTDLVDPLPVVRGERGRHKTQTLGPETPTIPDRIENRSTLLTGSGRLSGTSY